MPPFYELIAQAEREAWDSHKRTAEPQVRFHFIDSQLPLNFIDRKGLRYSQNLGSARLSLGRHFITVPLLLE